MTNPKPRQGNLGPIREPLDLAAMLDRLVASIPATDDAGLAIFYRSELSMLAAALTTHAAEQRSMARARGEPIPFATAEADAPMPSPCELPRPSCSPGFGIVDSTPYKGSDSG